MAERVQFKAGQGDAEGELVAPTGYAKAPGVVVVQEWWGVNNHIRSLLDRLARAGFLAMAPDLYHGKTTTNGDEAGQWMKALDRPTAIREIAGAVQHLKAHPRCNGHVGVIGFCMGGSLAFGAAATVPGLGAVVPFYGIPAVEQLNLGAVTAPIQAHFSATDPWATPALAKAAKKGLDALGKPMELHLYDAEHAFMNDTRPEVYNPTEAKTAWDRATKFLHQHLDG